MIRSQSNTRPTPRRSGLAFIGYVMVALWWLLMITPPASANSIDDQDNEVWSPLTASDIMPSLEAELMSKGMPGDAEISIAVPRAIVAHQSPVEFSHVSHNALSGRFVARIAETGAAVSGTVRIRTVMPVLSSAVQRGDVITADNVEFIEVTNANPNLFIDDADLIIGMEARRALRPGGPMRKNDLSKPVLVKRGNVVTVVFELQGLRLSHQAIASAAGGAGDLISVKNIQSEHPVRAIITGRDRVRVIAPAQSTNIQG